MACCSPCLTWPTPKRRASCLRRRYRGSPSGCCSPWSRSAAAAWTMLWACTPAITSFLRHRRVRGRRTVGKLPVHRLGTRCGVRVRVPGGGSAGGLLDLPAPGEPAAGGAISGRKRRPGSVSSLLEGWQENLVSPPPLPDEPVTGWTNPQRSIPARGQTRAHCSSP